MGRTVYLSTYIYHNNQSHVGMKLKLKWIMARGQEAKNDSSSRKVVLMIVQFVVVGSFRDYKDVLDHMWKLPIC